MVVSPHNFSFILLSQVRLCEGKEPLHFFMIFKHRLIIYQVSILGKKKGKFVSGISNIVVHCVNGEEVGYGTFASLPGVIKRNSSSKQFSRVSKVIRSVIGPKKLVPLSQPIRCKTKTHHDLVVRVFARFRQLVCFYF